MHPCERAGRPVGLYCLWRWTRSPAGLRWCMCVFVNPAGLLVISRDSTIPLVSLCVHRDAPTIPVGSLCIHRDAPSHKPPIKMHPSTFLPHPRFSVFILPVVHLTRDSTAQRVCSPGAGFNPPDFLSPCGLPVSRYVTSPVASTGCPSVLLTCRSARSIISQYNTMEFLPP